MHRKKRVTAVLTLVVSRFATPYVVQRGGVVSMGDADVLMEG
jgi:hypothetical protein